MQNSLKDFMKKITIINKDLSLYKDEEKGTLFYINTVHLLTRVDYLELDKKQYEMAIFENKIEKLEYKETNTKKPVPKNLITKREEDKYTLVDKEFKAKQVWNVTNSAGMFNSFTNKEEAVKYAEEINEKVFKKLEK